MTNCHNMEAVDRSLRDIFRPKFPFDGIEMLWIEDS